MNILEIYKLYFLSLLKITLVFMYLPIVFILFIITFPVVWIEKVQYFLSSLGDVIDNIFEL